MDMKFDKNVLFFSEDHSSGKIYRIPSQLYPLNGPLEIFTVDNTEDCIDPRVIDVYNSVASQPGFCYQNATDFVSAAIAAGLDRKLFRTYVGWLFVGGEFPIHHCFTLYENSLFDFCTDVKYQFSEGCRGLSYEDAKSAFIELHLANQGKKNSEKYGVGKVDPLYLYVGSRCSPNEGRSIFRKLRKAQPNHPSYSTMRGDKNGQSSIQKELQYKLERRNKK